MVVQLVRGVGVRGKGGGGGGGGGGESDFRSSKRRL